jgi:Domain of unknown function (DUF6456)
LATKRRAARARRRIAKRTAENLLRLEAAVTQATEAPKILKEARTRTRLDELEARGAIEPGHRDAGIRLASDYQRSGEGPRHLVQSYGPRMPKSASDILDSARQIDARRRFEKALQAVGKWLSPVLIHVAILDEAPCHWAERYGRPAKDGIACLRLALDALMVHYGMRSWPQAA